MSLVILQLSYYKNQFMTDREKGQIGDLDIQQEDFIKDVMVLVFHDWAGSEKRLEV